MLGGVVKAHARREYLSGTYPIGPTRGMSEFGEENKSKLSII